MNMGKKFAHEMDISDVFPKKYWCLEKNSSMRLILVRQFKHLKILLNLIIDVYMTITSFTNRFEQMRKFENVFISFSNIFGEAKVTW